MVIHDSQRSRHPAGSSPLESWSRCTAYRWWSSISWPPISRNGGWGWHGSLNVPIFHITQPKSVYGLLDGYYGWWCPIFPKWDSYQPLDEEEDSQKKSGKHIAGGWATPPKNMSQLGLSFPNIWEKHKFMFQNHQPVIESTMALFQASELL